MSYHKTPSFNYRIYTYLCPDGNMLFITVFTNAGHYIGGRARISVCLSPVGLYTELGMVSRRLPPWQRTLDLVVLTTPLRDHLSGLLDVENRYQITTVIDAGMLHPGATYAQWRRNITERHQHYLSVVQGMTIPRGNVALQVLWPSTQLHKSSDENRDNGLVVRLVAPGLNILLLGVAAQSRYALTGLLDSIAASYLQAQDVQIVGTPGKAFPAELGEILQQVQPQFLVTTPSALSTKQRKASAGRSTTSVGATSQSSVTRGTWQTIETAQVGAVEITSTPTHWNITSTS